MNKPPTLNYHLPVATTSYRPLPTNCKSICTTDSRLPNNYYTRTRNGTGDGTGAGAGTGTELILVLALAIAPLAACAGNFFLLSTYHIILATYYLLGVTGYYLILRTYYLQYAAHFRLLISWYIPLMTFTPRCSLLTTCYRPPTTYYLLLATCGLLRTAYCSLHTTHYVLLTTCYLVPITHYLLLTSTYYLLPNTYCLPRAAY